jgi:hypothetical protein
MGSSVGELRRNETRLVYITKMGRVHGIKNGAGADVTCKVTPTH